MKHMLHFTDNHEMSYAASYISEFVNDAANITEDEFDGDAPNEVTFTTAKPIARATIKKMVAHFDPKDSSFNQ